MPVDKDGNRADIVMDDGSTISRMNLGRLFEQYTGAAARDVTKNIRKMVGLEKTTKDHLMNNLNQSEFKKVYGYLLGFYRIVSNKQYDYFADGISEEDKYEHLADVINDGVYVYYPVNNNKSRTGIIRKLQKYYPPCYGPVTYRGNSGNMVTTNCNVRIGPLYIMLLDKIADDWSSVSSGKLQHFGVLSPVIKSEKFTYPYRNSPVRTIGETEGRIFAGYAGRNAIAELMDRSNNPITQRNMYYNILAASQPTNIDYAVDRNISPLGGSRPLQLIKHIFQCSGIKMKYIPDTKDYSKKSGPENE